MTGRLLTRKEVELSKMLDRAAAYGREAQRRQRENTFLCGDCNGGPCYGTAYQGDPKRCGESEEIETNSRRA